ncbi:MAG: Mur ligase family protein [Parcubacteria group bacterium]|jgi:UDP-N-acetylmuramoyl-tripeptide--D-alanyl-D-alanine ligase
MISNKSRKIVLLERILRRMAVLVLKKYNPKIISVTGSVGKTSTKEAIYVVMASKFRVRKTEKNYNNEIGLPLTIIGVESGENSILRWGLVLLKWLWIMLAPIEYPEILVLEMGADKPGDIKYLTSFVASNAGVITDFSSSHIEFFKTIEGVAKEKSILVKKLSAGGLAVLNVDNPYVAKLEQQLKCNVVTFGFAPEAQMRATDFSFSYVGVRQDLRGLSFKLNYKGTTLPVRLNNVLAKHQIYSALAAVAIGTGFGINLVEAGAALENFSLPGGRMNLVLGMNKSYIIDDTYNASPVSVAAALGALNEVAASSKQMSRKLVVLGDMLELGNEETDRHREVGRKIMEIGVEFFVAVGDRMHLAGEEIIRHGFPKEKVFYCASPMEAGKKMKELIAEGDYILVKGSQGMRMEKVIEEIMQNPQEEMKVLCRQNKHWKEITWRKV